MNITETNLPGHDSVEYINSDLHIKSDLIDWEIYNATRSELGVNFGRVFGYFREDGTRCVATIETAMRDNVAAPMAIAAHRLTDDAGQFGAVQLLALAEKIEIGSMRCVDRRDTPEELIGLVVALRPLFNETITLLEDALSPLMVRQPQRKSRQ